MIGPIIWYVVNFGCAILFYSIGAYAQKLETPMHFYSGTTVDPAQISDIKAYNKENARMWKLYSLWYVTSGLAEIWSADIALILLIAACAVGLPVLIYTYSKIFKKYRRNSSCPM